MLDRIHEVVRMRLEILPVPLIHPAIAEGEGAYQFREVRRLVRERFCRRRKLFGLCGVRLGHLVHLRHGRVYLFDAGALFSGSMSDLAHQLSYPLD